MNPSLEAVTEWLNANSNQILHISKVEEQDRDQVNLHLKRAELQRRQVPSIDGYADMDTLLLEEMALSLLTDRKPRSRTSALRLHWTDCPKRR